MRVFRVEHRGNWTSLYLDNRKVGERYLADIQDVCQKRSVTYGLLLAYLCQKHKYTQEPLPRLAAEYNFTHVPEIDAHDVDRLQQDLQRYVYGKEHNTYYVFTGSYNAFDDWTLIEFLPDGTSKGTSLGYDHMTGLYPWEHGFNGATHSMPGDCESIWYGKNPEWCDGDPIKDKYILCSRPTGWVDSV